MIIICLRTIRECALDSKGWVTQVLPRTRIQTRDGRVSGLWNPVTPPASRGASSREVREGSKAGMYLCFRRMAREGDPTHQDLVKLPVSGLSRPASLAREAAAIWLWLGLRRSSTRVYFEAGMLREMSRLVRYRSCRTQARGAPGQSGTWEGGMRLKDGGSKSSPLAHCPGLRLQGRRDAAESKGERACPMTHGANTRCDNGLRAESSEVKFSGERLKKEPESDADVRLAWTY